jgi:hypothetical protein
MATALEIRDAAAAVAAQNADIADKRAAYFALEAIANDQCVVELAAVEAASAVYQSALDLARVASGADVALAALVAAQAPLAALIETLTVAAAAYDGS